MTRSCGNNKLVNIGYLFIYFYLTLYYAAIFYNKYKEDIKCVQDKTALLERKIKPSSEILLAVRVTS